MRNLAPGTSDAVEMVHLMDPHAVALPDGALTAETEANRATFSAIKKVRLKFAALPNDSHHTFAGWCDRQNMVSGTVCIECYQ